VGASPHATAALEAEINGLRQIGELLRRELETCGRTAIGGAGRRRRLALGLPNATESATPKRPCDDGSRAEMARRFPPPWSAEESEACFIVRDANGQALARTSIPGDEPRVRG
jgi:hypothetical protein